MSSPLLAFLASSGFAGVEAIVCLVCLVLLLRSDTIAPDVARLGVAGFVCVLLAKAAAIGSMLMFTTMRNSFESVANLGLVMAAFNFVRFALEIAGLICLARALLATRAHGQASA
ncbi:MAG TPA: hypothetical protein VJS12_25400 [Steroidobacteraceae bacterium]|nr:hypothetical protein [Steroidobacteraceae bacterium]